MDTELKERAERILASLNAVARPDGALAHALARNASLAVIADHAREEGFEAQAEALEEIAAALAKESAG
ncbi:hypothetical protein [Pelomicrobium sp. G1]|uniref:hypothetical protein n=1 Tax=unclassified Pelomicrobium TaxID=2815318 RepID=UPI0021DD13CF|nr:MAG: hypothetical protein KatS3mg123_1122 [Burkholderiales bacterium]